jgi:ribonucleoside-diphosphate reductase alpha chain
MFNPCFEILKIPVLDNIDFSKIDYEDVEQYVAMNKDKFGIQGCNLSEINAEKCTTKEKFFKACKDATILGTLQAGYNSFPYLGETSEKIFAREALLGVSITGWMNNPMLFNAELLREGAEVVKKTNKELAEVIGINQAARTTCVKPSGNASVVLGTASGIHPEHSEKYFRVMQLNKESNTAKWLVDNMDFLLEESVWSQTKSDYVVFVPVENPKKGLFKKDMKGIKHLELIKLVQQNWVNAGTNPEKCVYNPINHNTSCTVIIDDKDTIVSYIWDNKEEFTAVSFMSDYGDKDFNQAPFTSVLNLEELVEEYGKGAVLASGLVVDGLHYFDNNLWLACDTLINMGTEYALPITGTREQVLLKKYWLDRAKKFAKNYFKGDMRKMVYCLKDVHLFHKWETVTRQFKEVNFGEILDKPQYKDIGEFGAIACSGDSCEIVRI